MSDRAAEVLAEVFGMSPAVAADAVASLLAATETGEPVVITAEGRLMRLDVLRPADACRCAHDHWSACTTGQECPCLTETHARLTPLEGFPKGDAMTEKYAGEHQFDGLDRGAEGWDFSSCSCGWVSPPCPDTDTACDFWGDHLKAEVTR